MDFLAVIKPIGAVLSLVLQIIGSIVVIRWVWRETSEGGRIHRAVKRNTEQFLDWWMR